MRFIRTLKIKTKLIMVEPLRFLNCNLPWIQFG